MEFFKDLESVNSVKMSGLKAGKAAEQAEFDNLLREVEKDLDQAAAQAPRRRSEDEVRAAQFVAVKCSVVQYSAVQRSTAYSLMLLPLV